MWEVSFTLDDAGGSLLGLGLGEVDGGREAKAVMVRRWDVAGRRWRMGLSRWDEGGMCDVRW